jgi:hypothetical protein
MNANPMAQQDGIQPRQFNGAMHDERPTSSQSLASIAASANELEASLPVTYSINGSPVETNGSRPLSIYSDVHALRPISTWPNRYAGHDHQAPEGTRAATFPKSPSTSPSRHLANGSNNVYVQPRAQKVRGKFSDARRREVQEVRKKGACIRCRMLRKTV